MASSRVVSRGDTTTQHDLSVTLAWFRAIAESVSARVGGLMEQSALIIQVQAFAPKGNRKP